MAEAKPNVSVKKSSKKLILMIALVLLVLGGAAAGYFFFLKQPADEAHSQASSGKTSKKKEEAKVEEPEIYYDLAAPLVVNFPPGSSAKIIKVSVSVLVKGEASVDVLKKHEPMIRNNLLMGISSIGADKVKTIEGKRELQAMMQSEIGKVMEKMAGENAVKDVYFTEFVMQ